MGLTGRYRLLQAAFWMMFCVGQGYITFYLTHYGYTTGEIGMLTAAFGLVAAFTQTRVGRLSDRGGRYNWRALIRILSVLCFVLMLTLSFLKEKYLVGLFYGLFIVGINAMLPLVNAGCFYLNQEIAANKSGEKPIDFAFARGLGSLSFAILSFALGRLTAAFGKSPVTIAGMGVALCIFFAASLIRYEGNAQNEKDQAQPDEEKAVQENDGRGFFARYPVVMTMMAGLVCVLTFHNIINTYLLQIMQRVGGDSLHMGTALAIEGLCEVPTMFLFVKIKKRFSSGCLLVVSGAVYILRVLLMMAARSVSMIYATEVLQLATFALYASAAVYYVEEMVEEKDRTKGQALVGGGSTLGQVIGNLVGGFVLQYFGVGNLLLTGCGLITFGTAVITIAYRKGRAEGEALPQR